jgi:type IV secretory pathway VirB10-like protein
MNPCINPVPETIPEHEETDTLSHETRKIKHVVAMILIGLIALAGLFLVLVAKNVPEQPVFEFEHAEPMPDDIRPAQLLERLEETAWNAKEDKETELAAVLPSEVSYKPMQTAMPSFAEDEQAQPSDPPPFKETTMVPLSNTLLLTTEVEKEAGQAPISVYAGDQHRASDQSDHNARLDLLSSDDNNALINVALAAQQAQDPYQQQNQQASKHAFLQGKTQQASDTRAESILTKRHSPYTITAGSGLPATLVTGINSDLPGSVMAKINQAIYDTATGNHLLIPQGSTLLGQYDSQISFGQSRVLLVWSRIIFPNGDSVNLSNMPGVDLLGMSGLKDKVNYHTARLFSSVVLFSSFSALGQLGHHDNNTNAAMTDPLSEQTNNETSNNPGIRTAMMDALNQQISSTGNQLIQSHLRIQPTIEIRPGTRFYVMLTRDLVLEKHN